MRTILLIYLVAFFLSSISFAQVRSVTLRKDELLTVKTALGIATIVQVPQAIQSAIIGDQSGFKVEYLEKAVTLKPLRSGARTNLYLVTEANRYSLRLTTIGQDGADYIVYVKDPAAKEQLSWKVFEKNSLGKELAFKIIRIGLTAQGFVLIEGRLTSKISLSIKPGEFWIFQGNSSKVISHLFVSNLNVSSKTSVTFGFAISKSDLISNRAISIEYRGSEKLAVVLPESIVWN